MKKGTKAAKTTLNIAKVAKFIEVNPDTHLREIARNLKLHPYVTQKCIREINEFIVTRSFNEEAAKTLPNLPIMIRLKEGITAEGIARYLRTRDKLRMLP